MPRIVESDAQARQGPSGRPVLMVLIGAFALIGLYLLSMLFWAGSTSPDSTSQDASRTAVTGSPSGSANLTTRTPPANPAYPLRSDMTTGSTTPSGTTDNSLHQPKKE
jgi:cytoskeletal protein RodZ